MTNRSDCVLIQQASGPYKPLLALTVGNHLQYCGRHGMDYWPIFGEARHVSFGKPPHYDRVALLQKALSAGYYSAIWLDADCVITGDDDMREAIPERGIGALWCKGDWGEDMYDHWCTGALYVSLNGTTHNFLHKWMERDFCGHGWVDQHAFNQLWRKGDWSWDKDLIKPISRHWHTILPDFPSEDDRTPQVVAFHGYGDLETRLACMMGLFGDYKGVR